MYDDVKVFSKTLQEFDFGGGAAEILQFRLPPGYTGRLLNIGVSVTEVFAVDATSAGIQCGTTADPDAYGKLTIPDAVADLDFYDKSDDTDAIILAEPIPADSLIRITLTNGTDGTAVTGKGHPQLDFEIWK
jgi:hypothetical protein